MSFATLLMFVRKVCFLQLAMTHWHAFSGCARLSCIDKYAPEKTPGSEGMSEKRRCVADGRREVAVHMASRAGCAAQSECVSNRISEVYTRLDAAARKPKSVSRPKFVVTITCLRNFEAVDVPCGRVKDVFTFPPAAWRPV